MGSMLTKLMCLVCLIGGLGFAWTARASYSPIRELRAVRVDLAQGNLPKRTDQAIDALIKVAVVDLRARGHDHEADEIEGAYFDRFEGFLEIHAAGRGFLDLGDHKPLSDWLAGVTEILRLLLGDTVMKMTHLDDLRILNYAIPVVFSPCTPEWHDRLEYKKHFVPLSGVLAYWSLWVACKVAGGWSIPMTCSAIGSLGENIMIYVFSGPISDAVFSLAKCD